MQYIVEVRDIQADGLFLCDCGQMEATAHDPGGSMSYLVFN